MLATRTQSGDQPALDAPHLSEHVVQIRSLALGDAAEFQAHLLRLDRESRRTRFGHAVSDSFIADYVARILSQSSVVKGCFIDGVCRGVAEAVFIEGLPHDVEAAFSIERPWQGFGLGTLLFRRLVRAVRNRGGTHLCVLFVRENRAMMALAKRLKADIRFEEGSYVGEIERPENSIFSVGVELFEDNMFMYLTLPDDPAEQ